MKLLQIAGTPLQVSRIALGCMRLGGCDAAGPLNAQNGQQAVAAIRAALDEGINLFDHADIYGHGKCEEVFAHIWDGNPGLRERIILQSKCGIWLPGEPGSGSPGRYDFSYDHLMHAVEGILTRLKTDHLDLLLLHRPDPLVEPEEVARAFDELQSSGKVRFFGVSNHTAAQIELLRKFVKQPLVVNQVELSLVHNQLVNAGVVFNQDEPPRPQRNDGTLEYCRQHDILVQAWGPVASGSFLDERRAQDERGVKTARVIAELAQAKNVSREAIAIAWLLRIPARPQPIIGTTNPEHIRAACEADRVELTREEWYRLFVAGRGAPVP
jgi:predicted oxidoreductase